MKVIKKGREQHGWSIEKKCTGSGNGGGGCGALLLVSEYDLYKTHSYDYGGGHDVYITFKCPCCGVQTDIANGEVPSRVYSSIGNKPRGYSGAE